MKKAFTIIELLVAMGLLSMLIAISGLVFSTAIKAHRAANATAEISAKLQTFTQQLDADFRGLRKEMPVAFWFERGADGRRYDQIQFFADGTFETSKQWEYIYTDTDGTLKTKTVTLEGNIARIYYGHANNVTINAAAKTRTAYRLYNAAISNSDAYTRNRAILARRAHLLEQVNSALKQFPANITFVGTPPVPAVINYSTIVFHRNFFPWFTTLLYGNDVFEYDNIDLSEWMNVLTGSTNVDWYLTTCFANPVDAVPNVTDLGGRPGIDLAASDGESLHMIMAQGVGSFNIQLAYMAAGGVLSWWPSDDPNGDKNTSDSDFIVKAAFGYYVNFAAAPSLSNWYDLKSLTNPNLLLTSGSFPQALKFTFTLYDSNGVFPEGKTFTYIVYVN